MTTNPGFSSDEFNQACRQVPVDEFARGAEALLSLSERANLETLKKSPRIDAPDVGVEGQDSAVDIAPSRRSLKLSLAIAGAAAVLLTCVFGNLVQFARSSALVDSRRDLLSQVDSLRAESTKLKNERDELLRGIELLEPTREEQESYVFVSAVLPDVNLRAVSRPSGTVKVSLQNATFPIVVQWTVGDSEKQLAVGSGNTAAEFPAGDPVTIFCRPVKKASCFQAVGVVISRDGKDEYLGSSLGKIVVPLRDGDHVTLYFEQPAAPWNATMLRIRGEWALVTLERPWATFELHKLIDPKQVKLPNTILFWSREGTDGLARELARTFVAGRESNSELFEFRGKMDTSLTVPHRNGRLADVFVDITEDELVANLRDAFELLERQRQPVGPSIRDEIAKATEILDEMQRTGKKPD